MDDILQDVVHVGDLVEVTYNDSLIFNLPEPYNSLQIWEGVVTDVEETRFWIEQKFGAERFISRVLKDSEIYRYHVKNRFGSKNILTN
jgi:hypothetical protein